MNGSRSNIRVLLPNLEWLELSRICPSWQPLPATVRVTSAVLEILLTSMEGLSETDRARAVIKFFASFDRLVTAKSRLGRVGEQQAELVIGELDVGVDCEPILVGFRRGPEREWWFSATEDCCG